MQAGPVSSVVYFAGGSVPARDRSLAPPRYRACAPGELRIEPISAGQMQTLLPMIAAYQRFYEVGEIDEERNRAFFSRFLAPSEDGMLIGAWATAPDNKTAQRLYDSTGAERSTWIEYELGL